MFEIHPEEPRHGAEVEILLDKVFGPERRTAKTIYRLREGVPPIAGLCFTVREGATLLGTLRFWPVRVGAAHPALLLGPIAVEPARRGAGLGAGLIEHGLARARALGHRAVVLVGDETYYGRFGFRRALAAGLRLPGPADPARLLAAELVPGALDGAAGLLGPGRRLRRLERFRLDSHRSNTGEPMTRLASRSSATQSLFTFKRHLGWPRISSDARSRSPVSGRDRGPPVGRAVALAGIRPRPRPAGRPARPRSRGPPGPLP